MEFVNSLDISTQTRDIISNEKLQKLAHWKYARFGRKNDSNVKGGNSNE